MNNDNATNQQQAGQNPWALLKPNWDAWKSVKQAKLWEAASLACGVSTYIRRREKRSIELGTDLPFVQSAQGCNGR